MDDRFESARAAFVDGVRHFEAERLHEAEACFVQSLQCVPGRASTRVNLAATRIRLGRSDEAAVDLEALLDAEPQHLDAWRLRAAALAELGRDEESLRCAEHLLAQDASDAAGWFRRGHALERLRRFGDALVAFERAATLRPDDAEIWSRMAPLQQRLGHPDDALRSCERVLALQPRHAATCSRRGSVLKDLGRGDEAAAAFERAIALGADEGLHRFFIGALRGGDGPAQAPRAYVQALFDDYADDFDEHLVGVLGYRAHRTLVEPLAALHPAPFDRALDLGCGTGLCGPLLRPMVRRLEGIDLSGPMLERAAALQVYDRLVQADIVAFLQGDDGRSELVVAADVFIYVGELAEVFAAVRRVLAPRGVFCFSVERAGDAEAVRLTRELRYAHSAPYLLMLAQQHGLQPLRVVEQPIRHDQAHPIDGLYCYLQAP